MADTTTEVKAILARTLRELEQVIDNLGVKSVLRGLGDILGVADDGAKATTKPVSRRTAQAKRKPVAPARESTVAVARVAQGKSAPAAPRARAKPGARSSGAPGARAGGRREQLLAVVVEQPGVTLAQAAEQFGVKDATGLYRVARRLQDEGLVSKRGAELHPTARALQK